MSPQGGTFEPGRIYEGFRLDRITPLPGLRAAAYQFEHVKSGARLLHVYTEDTENCFAVTFPTPPPDDTGVPHILEHAVLGGSKKFPVREPFFEILKMSLATFINAMTAPAYTVYPVATNVKKDFFNLAEVYLDAVFHPRLDEATFRREGHHFTLESNNDLSSALTLKGIVYSEMKGAYSNPEGLVYRRVFETLLAGTPMGRDSGGDPDHIPDLTYEQFRRFHETYYHPSNGLVFIYGDIPTQEHLRFLAPTLNDFDRTPVEIPTPRQPRWRQPVRMEKVYPIGRTEDAAARTYIILSWLADDAMDPSASMEWSALSRILVGDEAAPLKKAIIDAKLGADLFAGGAWAIAYESMFAVGLKGSEPDRAEAFEKLVLDTLLRIASERIKPERVEAAFQQLAYQNLEVTTLFPLSVLTRANMTWPYGGDPITFLRMDRHLSDCRKRYAADPQLFNRLIRNGLLENPHRLRLTLRPDRDEASRAADAFAKQMAEQRARFSTEEIASIAKGAAELEAAQSVPNPPEALARLPQLKVGDLPARPRHIPTTVSRIAGMEVLRNDVLANGVNYLEIAVDVAGLPADRYEYLPRYSDAFNKIGAGGQSYTQIAERRAACTGGLWCSLGAMRHATAGGRCLRTVRFGLKTLDDQGETALRLLGDLIFGVDPRDRERLRDLQTQSRAWYRTALVDGGMGTASRQAGRGLSQEAALDWLFMGPPVLRLMDDLALRFDANSEKLIGHIEFIRQFLLNRKRWTLSFTGSDRVFASLERMLQEWGLRMRGEAVADSPAPFVPFVQPPREGLAGPLKIAHCVKVMPAPPLSHPDAPLLKLGMYLTSFDYCLPEIRLKGNAYGAGAYYDDNTGTVRLYSGYDPHVVETLSVFDRVRDFVNTASWTEGDMERGIIGSVKDAERPIRPAEATGTALTRRLRGDTNEFRERRYEATLRATARDTKRVLLEQLDAAESRAAVCVVSSREKLEEANRLLGDKALSVSDILT